MTRETALKTIFHYIHIEMILDKYVLSILTLLGILGNVLFYACSFRLKRKPHYYIYIYYMLICDVSSTINFVIWPIVYLLWAVPGCSVNRRETDPNLINKVYRSFPGGDPINNTAMKSCFPSSYFVCVARYHWYFEEVFAANVNWMAAFIGIDRLFALYKPFSYGKIFTKKRIICLCAIVTILNFFVSAPYATLLTGRNYCLSEQNQSLETTCQYTNRANLRMYRCPNKKQETQDDYNNETDRFNATAISKSNVINNDTVVIYNKHDNVNENSSCEILFSKGLDHSFALHDSPKVEKFKGNQIRIYHVFEHFFPVCSGFFDITFVIVMYVIPLILSLTCNVVIIEELYVRRVQLKRLVSISQTATVTVYARLAEKIRIVLRRRDSNKVDIAPMNGCNNLLDTPISPERCYVRHLDKPSNCGIKIDPLVIQNSNNFHIPTVLASVSLNSMGDGLKKACPGEVESDRKTEFMTYGERDLKVVPTININLKETTNVKDMKTGEITGQAPGRAVPGASIRGIVFANRCTRLLKQRCNEYSRQAAIKTSILIVAQSVQIFVFNLPYIAFVFWSRHLWQHNLGNNDGNHRATMYDKQLIVHLIKQFGPLLGVYVNLIFDKNIRDIYVSWWNQYISKVN